MLQSPYSVYVVLSGLRSGEYYAVHLESQNEQ
jgi:hypothetical protein